MINSRTHVAGLRFLVALSVASSSAVGPVWAAKQPDPKDDPARHYELGVQFLGQARPDRAAAELEKAVDLEPSSTVMLNALGLAYIGKKDWKRAEKTFLKVLELDPFLTDAHNNLGIVYSEQGDPARARAEWELCLADTKYRTPEAARFNIGRTLLQQGKASDALPYLKAAVDAKPDNAEWLLRQGQAFQALERWSDARTAYDAALVVKPNSVETLFQLAIVSLELKDQPRAVVSLKRVIELSPGTSLATRAQELLKGLAG